VQTRPKDTCCCAALQASKRLQSAEAEAAQLRALMQEAGEEMRELRAQNQGMRSCLLSNSSVLLPGGALEHLSEDQYGGVSS
jgi:hypothetical protein